MVIIPKILLLFIILVLIAIFIKKLFHYKKMYALLLICTLFILFLFLGGYRFTSIQAVKSSLNDSEIIKVFGEVKRDWGTVYLLETNEGIKTVLAEKKGFLWSCPASTYFFDDVIKNDDVKTVGWVNYTSKNNKQITVFAVQTNDPNIQYIGAGSNLDKQIKPINLNETAIFIWDKSIGWNDLNAIALDNNNSQKYKYQYDPKKPSVSRSEDLRWYLDQGE